MKDEEDELSRFGCSLVADEALARVIITSDTVKPFTSLDERTQARLVRVIQLWCKGMNLTPEQFNPNEGRCQKGNINRLLQAFKTHGVRLYGFTRRLLGKKTFIILDADPAKKQNRADQGILKRAKDRVIKFEEDFGGRDEG